MAKRAKIRKVPRRRSKKGSGVPQETFKNIDEFKKHFFPKSSPPEDRDRTNDNHFGADLANSSLKRHAAELVV